MSRALYLAELTVWDPDIGAERTLRFSTQPGFTTRPDDVTPNTYFEPRMLQPIDVQRSMFTPGATMGPSSVGFGDLVLGNADGALDGMLRYAFDGRELVTWRTEAIAPRFPDDFTEVLIGTMKTPDFSGNVVSVPIRDRQADLDVPLQPTKYAGTNALPAGLEGTPDDLAGKPKPVLLGVVKQIDPPLVNTDRRIYQVNDGPVKSIDGVYDRGAPLVAGGAYLNQSDMETNAPTAGQYRAWLEGGCFRLGASPVGMVTADVTQGEMPADRTAAAMFADLIGRARLANEWAPVIGEANIATDAGVLLITGAGDLLVSTGDIHVGDLNALNAENDAELGFWTKDEMTIGAAATKVVDSVGAGWWTDRVGTFRAKQLNAPLGDDPALVVRQEDLLRPIERLGTSDPGGGLPVHRQILRWGKFYATQTTDLGGAVTDARRAELATQWREIALTNSTVQQAHLLSPEVSRESLFAHQEDALAETARRLGLYEIRRDRFEVVLQLNSNNDTIGLGDEIEILHPRYGLSIDGSTDRGIPFVVLGVAQDARASRLTLTVWGSTSSMANLGTRDGSLFLTSAGEHLTARAA